MPYFNNDGIKIYYEIEAKVPDPKFKMVVKAFLNHINKS